MTKQQQRKEDLLKHYSRLAELYRICGADKVRTGKQLSVRLRAMENEGHRAAENYFSIESYGAERLDKVRAGIIAEVKSLFPGLKGFVVNVDPRGYFLKIVPETMESEGYRLTTDLGGYGILSPEI